LSGGHPPNPPYGRRGFARDVSLDFSRLRSRRTCLTLWARRRYILKQKAQISIKKNELEKLQARLTGNGKYGDANTIDVEKDIKRMELKLFREREQHELLEGELQSVEQKIFELELHKMEAKFQAGGGGSDSDASDGSSGGGGGAGSDVSVSSASEDGGEVGDENFNWEEGEED
jgi:hypothetical protein